MGKSEKKKNQNKDFQKVKLKVGKTLPKGLNETVATFKSRSIQVKEQLKADRTDNEPTTRRKLSLPDLLSQCQHYNTTVKHDALTGLKELLMAHPELTLANLALILERSSELFMDKDPVVRTTVQKVLRLIFTQVSSNQIAPFFPSLSAHLCCAMTHINDGIQQDSLVILDLCLENCPELVTASSNQIMPNFIEQISRQTQTSKSGSQERSLLVNPNSKLSSQKWRNRVMERLQKFFKALLHQKQNAKSQATGLVAQQHRFSIGRCNDVQLCGSARHLNEGWFRLTDLSEQKDCRMRSFVESLVPLLLQCWVEAGPSQLATSLPGNCLSGDALSTLWNVVSLLQLLLELLDTDDATSIDWFSQKYFKDLLHYFLPYFPYSMHEKPRHPKGQGSKAKGQKEVTPQISILTLNLAVCKVFSYFLSDGDPAVRAVSRQWQSQILDYMCEGLPGCRLTEEQLTLTVNIVQKVLASTNNYDTVSSLLSLTFGLFKRCTDVISKEARLLLKFFGDFTFSGNALLVDRSPVLTQWMASLPSLMWLLIEASKLNPLDAVAHRLLHYLKSAGPLAEESFLSNLKTLLFDHVFAVEDDKLNCLPTDLQKNLVELVHWVPVTHIDTAKYQRLAIFCRNPHVPRDVTQHLLFLVTRKYQTAAMATEDCHVAEYLSFMLSLVIGKDSQTCSRSFPSHWKTEICNNTLAEGQWDRQLVLLKTVPDLVRGCQKGTELSDAVMEFLNEYLTLDRLHKLTIWTALGLLHLVAVLSREQCETAQDSVSTRCHVNSLLSQLFAAVISYLVASDTTSVHTAGNLQKPAMETDEDNRATKANVNSMEPTERMVESFPLEVTGALWEVCVQVVVDLQGLFQLYVSEVQHICSSGLFKTELLKHDISGLTKLVRSSELKGLVKSHRGALQSLVTHIDALSQDFSTDKWWHQFKYEVSLL